MRPRVLPLVMLMLSSAALVVSVGWAAARGDHGDPMSRYGSGMMGLSTANRSDTPIRDLSSARQRAQRYADQLGLKTGEVMSFSRNYYVELLERNGRRATEVLVDPTTGAVWPEYGPAMMWNTRYGMMSGTLRDKSAGMNGGMMGGAGNTNGGGMMGGAGMRGAAGMMGGAGMLGGAEMMGETGSVSPTARDRAPTVTMNEARLIAQRWLDRNASTLTAGGADVFPGYYTVHTFRGGAVAGMLSVNASSGAVWFHWWHGRFLSMDA